MGADHGQVEVGVTWEGGAEALPRAAVTDAPIAALLGNLPAEAVGVSTPAVEADGSPARLEPGPTRDLPVVQRNRPLCQVAHGEIERSVRCRVERWRHPVLILQRVVDQVIPGRSVRNDVRFRDDARRAHAEGSKDVILRSEEHTSELQSRLHLVCRLLLEKKKTT